MLFTDVSLLSCWCHLFTKPAVLLSRVLLQAHARSPSSRRRPLTETRPRRLTGRPRLQLDCPGGLQILFLTEVSGIRRGSAVTENSFNALLAAHSRRAPRLAAGPRSLPMHRSQRRFPRLWWSARGRIGWTRWRGCHPCRLPVARKRAHSSRRSTPSRRITPATCCMLSNRDSPWDLRKADVQVARQPRFWVTVQKNIVDAC